MICRLRSESSRPRASSMRKILGLAHRGRAQSLLRDASCAWSTCHGASRSIAPQTRSPAARISAEEAALVEGVPVYRVDSLDRAVRLFSGETPLVAIDSAAAGRPDASGIMFVA